MNVVDGAFEVDDDDDDAKQDVVGVADGEATTPVGKAAGFGDVVVEDDDDDSGKDVILPVLNAEGVVVIVDVVDDVVDKIIEACISLTDEPLGDPDGNPLKADADFFTASIGFSSIVCGGPAPLRNAALLPASTEVAKELVDVIGDSGGEA